MSGLFDIISTRTDAGGALTEQQFFDTMKAAMRQAGLGDAHNDPDTGKPPCEFCYRTEPCGCGPDICECTCRRCWR